MACIAWFEFRRMIQAKRRHTSFASVYVSPEIDDSIEIIIKPDDIRTDTYRSSGKGGQHVNTTDSAVRITHIATGLVASCQNERSQHKNRERAMSMLRSKLYEHEMEKKREVSRKIEDSKLEINFGSQIRSYVLQPYRMVKDHRTKVEIGDVDRVLDGDLQPFIRAYLRWRDAMRSLARRRNPIPKKLSSRTRGLCAEGPYDRFKQNKGDSQGCLTRCSHDAVKRLNAAVP